MSDTVVGVGLLVVRTMKDRAPTVLQGWEAEIDFM